MLRCLYVKPFVLRGKPSTLGQRLLFRVTRISLAWRQSNFVKGGQFALQLPYLGATIGLMRSDFAFTGNLPLHSPNAHDATLLSLGVDLQLDHAPNAEAPAQVSEPPSMVVTL